MADDANAKVFGKCNNKNGHGHNYKVEVTIRNFVNPVTGMVIDLQKLKSIMNDVLEEVDHKNLDLDVPYFEEHVSTTENLTIYLWQEISKRLIEPESLHEIVVHETDKNIFKYRGE